METISDRIKAIKKRYGLRNVDLADLAGVTKQSVGRWVNDGATPSQEALIALRDQLGISDEWVLTGRGGMDAKARESGFISRLAAIEDRLSPEDTDLLVAMALNLAAKGRTPPQG